MNNKKVEKFDEFIERSKLEWFQKLEQKDDKLDTVVYTSRLEIKDQFIPVGVILDNTVYTLIRLCLSPDKVEGKKKKELLEFLNELNAGFKIFKYYVDNNDSLLYMDVSVPCQPIDFNPETLTQILVEVVLPHMEEYYEKIQEKLKK